MKMFYPKSSFSQLHTWVKTRCQSTQREARQNARLWLRITSLILMLCFTQYSWGQAASCTFDGGAGTTVSEDFNTSPPPYTTNYAALGTGLGAILSVETDATINICFWGDMNATNETWDVVISGETFSAGAFGTNATSGNPVCLNYTVPAASLEIDLADGDIDISYENFGAGWVVGAINNPDDFNAQVTSIEFDYSIPLTINTPTDRCQDDPSDITITATPAAGTSPGDAASLQIFPSTAAFDEMTGELDVSEAAAGTYTVQYQYTINGCTYSTQTQFEIFAAPVAALQDVEVTCSQNGGTVDLGILFDGNNTAGGTWTIVAGPGGSINGSLLTYPSTASCFTIRYTVDNPNSCTNAPYQDQAEIFISIEPEPAFTISGATSPACSPGSDVLVTLTQTSAGPNPAFTINGSPAVAGPNLLPAPASIGSIVSEICLTESTANLVPCGDGGYLDACEATVCQNFTVYNDGVNCGIGAPFASECEPDPNMFDVCPVVENNSLSLSCSFFSLNGPQLIEAQVNPTTGIVQCSDEEVCFSWQGSLPGDLGNVATGGPTLGSLNPATQIICDIITFEICIDLLVVSFCIDPIPLGSFEDACDQTIGQFIFAALGGLLGGDGGGGILLADTDGDGAFDQIIEEYGPFPESGNSCVDNNISGASGVITIRNVTSWPFSPQSACGEITNESLNLLDLLPIGSLPLVGSIIEDLLAAASCDAPLSFYDAETIEIPVINRNPPVFANCNTSGYVFSEDLACTTEANWSIPIAYDGCGGSVLAYQGRTAGTDATYYNGTPPVVTTVGVSGIYQTGGPIPGSELPVGTYTVTYTAYSCAAVSSTCSFTVNVEAGDPILACPGDQTFRTDTDLCNMVVNGLAPLQGAGCASVINYSITFADASTSTTNTTYYGNEGTINDASGETFPLGTSTVTYFLEVDINGDGDLDDPNEQQECTFAVTVVDGQRPDAACTDLEVQLDNTGSVTIFAVDQLDGSHFIDGGSTDNCDANPLIEIAKPGGTFGASVSYECSETGANYVTLRVTDDAGNVSTCIAEIYVKDFFEGIQLDLDVPEICIDASNPEQLDFSNYLVVTLPNGTTIAHEQVAANSYLGDAVGGFGITAFAPSPGSLSIDPGSITQDGIYTPGDGTGYVTVSYLVVLPGVTVPQNGNIALAECLTIVHSTFELRQPLEMDSPECECISELERIVDLGQVSGGLEPYTIQYSGTRLDVDGDGIADDSDGQYTYDPDNGHDITDFAEDLGELRVDYTQPVWNLTIVDARGCEIFRSGSCDNDDLTEGPQITCPAEPDTLDTEPFLCEVHYEWQHPLPTDNCGVVEYTYQILNPDSSIVGPFDLNALLNNADPAPVAALFEAEYEFELGVSTISYYAEDAVGNFITCSFNVTVIDDDPPYFINCPYPPVIEDVEIFYCDAYVNFALPLAEDNCDMPVVTQIDNTGLTTGDRFPIGTTILYFEAVDLSGNRDTCQVKVVVNDTWAPLALGIGCPGNVTQGTDDWRCDAVVEYIAPDPYTICYQNQSIVYEIFDDAALTDRKACGVWDASGEVFDIGDSWVKYTTYSQPLLLITELSQSGSVDQLEITNFGPASYDISCLQVGRVTSNPAADEDLPPVSQLPALDPTIVGVGETFVFDFTFDGGESMPACYTISYMDVIIDQVAVNGYGDCAGFTGTLNSGDVYRNCEVDTDNAEDWTVPELCFPLTIGALNRGFEVMPDNGSTYSLESIPAIDYTCSFQVTIFDDEEAFCGELAEEKDKFDGAAFGIDEGACNRDTIEVLDGCIVSFLNLTISGDVTTDNATVTLISPAGTEVEITSLPALQLDDFYAEKSEGIWILDIVPNAGAGPLTISDWDFEFACMLPFDEPDATINNEPGVCGADFSWTHPYFVDNCFLGTISVNYTSLDADCVPSAGVLTGRGGYEVTEFFCVGTTTVTYTLVDLAGNISTCGFDVTVLDVENPIVVCPADITVNLNSGECRRSVCYQPVLATDNCEVVLIDYSIEPCSDFEIGTTPVTITIFDEAGNSATCTFNVEVIEYVPDSYDLFCNDLVNISLDASCEGEITADMIFEGNDYHCYEDYIITITDYLGNVISTNPIVTSDYIGETLTVQVYDPDSENICWGQITVEDKLNPEITCPDDLTIFCHESTDPSHTGYPELLSCEVSVSHTYNDVWNDFGTCSDIRGEIVRTWTVTDESDNSSTCTQVITIKRLQLDDVIFPLNYDGVANPAFACADVTANTSLLDPANTGAPTVTGLAITGAPLCGISVNMTEEIYDVCGGSYDILRIWSVYDPCSPAQIGVNPIQYLQTIKVLDNIGANLTCPANQTISTTEVDACLADYQIPAINITDNCTSFTVITDTPNGTLNTNGGWIYGLEIGTYTITYHVHDNCGNTTECSFELTVEDQTAPVAICDEITEVDLSSDGLATALAEVFDDGSYDNCCLDNFQARRMDGDCNGNYDDFGPTVEFCCSDAGSIVMVIFRVTDCYGNYNDCMVQVEVNDKLPPLLISCPGNQTITCDDYRENYEYALSIEDYSVLDVFGQPAFYDNCQLDLEYTVTYSTNTCGEGSIVRNWIASDASGTFPNSCTQTIFIEHVSDWVVEFPEDQFATCEDGSLPDFGEPNVFFDECELIATSFEDVLYTIVPDACYKIVRTWVVINWCVFDDFGFDAYSEANFAECNLFQDWDADGDQDCRTFRDGFNSNGTPDTADGYIAYEQVIKVVDEEAPIFSVEDQLVCIEEAQCYTNVVLPIPDVTDCSTDITIEVSANLPGATADPYAFQNVGPGVYDVLYTVTDECGNLAYDNVEVTVEDCKKPTPYCENGLIVEIMQTGMVEVWASDFDAGSFDNCPGPLQLSFSADVNDISQVFTCEDLGQQMIELWVTDAAGNQDFCTTFMVVQDNMNTCTNPSPLTIAGGLHTEMDQPIEGATVEVNSGQGYLQTTAGDGLFSFALPTGGDYTITPLLNDNPQNGVTTYDIVLITQHILGIHPLDSPYKLIAADANHSGTVSTLDLVTIRKVILMIDQNFQNNTSWRFVPEDFVFADPQNPFAEPFDELINYNNLAEDQLFANFIGIKIGDVNGSVQANSLVQVEARNLPSKLTVKVDDQVVKAGETVEVWFTANTQQVDGYQFSLYLNKQTLEVEQVLLGNLQTEHLGLQHQKDGLVHISWNTSATPAKDPKQFGFLLTAKEDGLLSEWIAIDEHYLAAQAYPKQGGIQGLGLEFENGTEQGTFALLDNRPNPFANSTSIRFQLPETTTASLRIYDASGRTVYSLSQEFAGGYHEVLIRQTDLQTTGVLYYQLQTESHSAVRRMLILD